MKKYYIAYGSNLNVPQMKRRCPDARVVGKATLEGYRLMFKGSKTGSYLTIEKAEGYSVPVGVWEVSEQDERNLDFYEGYPTFYYKKEVQVKMTGIRTGKTYDRNCFVYIMHEDHKFGIPSDFYLRVCGEGYRFFGFALDKLIEAYQFSKEVLYGNGGNN